jgi:hypothetical protein
MMTPEERFSNENILKQRVDDIDTYVATVVKRKLEEFQERIEALEVQTKMVLRRGRE